MGKARHHDLLQQKAAEDTWAGFTQTVDNHRGTEIGYCTWKIQSNKMDFVSF